MFRIDIKHIVEPSSNFPDFSLALTELAEVIMERSIADCSAKLEKSYGRPRLANKKPFDPSKVFEEAARLFAQSQPEEAIRLLTLEAGTCESTIDFARHHVRLSQERAATAHLEIGMIHRHFGRGVPAIQAFMSMLRVNPGDLDAFRMLGIQYRDMGLYLEAEQNFNALEYHVRGDPAAVADAKRELGAVFLGSRAFSRAEAVLNEAMAIEKSIPSQMGIALTHESIGAVQTARKRWAGAKRSYESSRPIFESLDDGDGVARVDEQLRNMEIARQQALRHRRERQKQQGAVLVVVAASPASAAH
jgi:tetratricopeptide (TPR) repeat protein